MKKLKKLSLLRLNNAELNDRQMDQVRGGNNCGCGCPNSNKVANYDTNAAGNLYSGGGSIICQWEMYGYAGVYGGSKAPWMP